MRSCKCFQERVQIILYFQILLSFLCYSFILFKNVNHIDGLMVSILTSSVVDHGFEPQLGQSNTKICICCFSAKQAALIFKEKEQGLIGSESG